MVGRAARKIGRIAVMIHVDTHRFGVGEHAERPHHQGQQQPQAQVIKMRSVASFGCEASYVQRVTPRVIHRIKVQLTTNIFAKTYPSLCNEVNSGATGLR